jgi:hypothetical protein
MIFTFSSTLNAGFFSSVAGGMVANSLNGNHGGTGNDGSARAYFVILNKKVNLLDIEVKILLGTNALTLILLVWIFFRQKKYPQYNQLSKKESISKGEKKNEEYN